jgi:DNA-binding PadR family transcriptional regulator
MCLADSKRRSLSEVTGDYNKRYPALIMKMNERTMRGILTFLEESGCVASEVLSFTTEPIPQTKFFRLTTLGFHELHRRR